MEEHLVEAFVSYLSLSRQTTITYYRRTDGIPGRGYSVRYEYNGEERRMPVMDGPVDVDMGGPFKLRYVTFTRGELTYWSDKVEE
jgi:hypothetical protein